MAATKRRNQRGEFERQVLEYTRRWNQGPTRRGLLKSAGLGAAGLASLALHADSAAAAPSRGSSVLRGAEQEGTTVRIARGQLTDTLDPQKTRLLVSHEIMWQIYDTLIYLDEEGIVHPGLATDWTFSDDNLTVTYQLREGISFHDGTSFNAQAVKDTVDRHLDPETASPTLDLLGPIESVEVVDDLTVAYNYTEPFVPMFVGLGYSYCAPISVQAAEASGEDFSRNPVGTGPYKFAEWTGDDSIVLEKNAEHDWATPFYSVQQPPQIDRVEFIVIPEDATRLSALVSGEVDIVAGTDAVPTDKINSLQEEPGIEVTSRPAVGVYYAGLNQMVEPFDDIRVRQAINHAVDTETLIGLVLDGNGTPATSMVASAFGYYTDDTVTYDYDPEKAKSLLAEAGLESGFETSYLNIASPVYQRAAEVIQENLSEVGITLNVESYPVAEWVPKGQSAEYGIQFFFYTGSDPNSLYSQLRTGQPFNWTYHEDEEIDAWLDAQRTEFGFDARGELFSNIQKRVNEEALVLYLWEGVYAAAHREQIQDLAINLIGFLHLQEMSIAE